MAELLPITERLYEKFEDAEERLSLYMQWIENEYEKYGDSGYFDNVFGNYRMVVDYIKNLLNVIADESPTDTEPAEAPSIMGALSDFLSALNHDRFQFGMEALGDALADIRYVLDEYDPL